MAICFVAANANALSNKETYGLQEKCAEDAEKFIKRHIPSEELGSSTYRNHYNGRLNKCIFLNPA